MKYLIPAVTALALGFASAANAAVTLEFNPVWGSTEGTGAAANATFTFADLSGNVQVTVDIDNITDTFGGAATQATLMGIAFDLPTFVGTSTYDANGSNFAHFKTNTSLPPFGTFDRSVGINNNFVGGNPGNGLLAGGTVTGISFIVDTTFNATDFEAAFLAGYKVGGDLNAAARFQVVNAGGGSDKVAGGVPPAPDPPVGIVPEPSTWAMMILGFGGAGAMLRRRRSAFA